MARVPYLVLCLVIILLIFDARCFLLLTWLEKRPVPLSTSQKRHEIYDLFPLVSVDYRFLFFIFHYQTWANICLLPST